MHRIADADVGDREAPRDKPVAPVGQRLLDAPRAAEEEACVILHRLREAALLGLKPCVTQHDRQRKRQRRVQVREKRMLKYL